jgi:hypothetical protein
LPWHALDVGSSGIRQPIDEHTLNMHLMATVLHLAKPVEVADNPRRLNALFKNAPEPQNGAFLVPSGPGLDLENLECRIKPL